MGKEAKGMSLLALTMGFSAVLGGPYINQQLLKEKVLPPVRHRETCPCCGKPLANLYFRNSGWRCRECWENTPEVTR